MMQTGILARAANSVAAFLSGVMRPRYMPVTLSPNGESQSKLLAEGFGQATQHGYAVTTSLLNSAKNERKKSKSTKLSVEEIQENIRNRARQLQEVFKVADPDTLAAKMVELLCVGVSGMAVLDNRRRVVAAWSAILAPSVVVREKWGEPITMDVVVDCAVDWVKFGYTDAAARTNRSRDTRFIAAHPSRMYQLVADSAHSAGVDHDLLITSLIAPVLNSMGSHVGALRTIDGIENKDGA